MKLKNKIKNFSGLGMIGEPGQNNNNSDEQNMCIKRPLGRPKTWWDNLIQMDDKIIKRRIELERKCNR